MRFWGGPDVEGTFHKWGSVETEENGWGTTGVRGKTENGNG